MSSRRRKYSENIMFTYSSILPPVMPSYSQISHFGGIQAHFHFMSSQLFYAQTFPHSTITNILEKTVLKPHLIFKKTQLTYLLICKRSHFDILRHRRSFCYIPFPNNFFLFRPCPNNYSLFRPCPNNFSLFRPSPS